MKLIKSLSWIAAVVAVTGLSASALANTPSLSATMKVDGFMGGDEKAVPENIDGSKVNARTQLEIARLSKVYVSGCNAHDAAVRASSLRDMRSLFDQDPKNMSVISWLGYAYIEEGQPAGAIQVLEGAVGRSRSRTVNVSNSRNLSVAYYKSGRYADVIKVTGGMDAADLDLRTESMLASSYYETKDYASSVKVYKHIESRGALDAVNCRNIGAAYMASKDYQSATPYLISCVHGDPTLVAMVIAASGTMVGDGHAVEAVNLLEGLDSTARATSSFNSALTNAYVQRGTDADVDLSVKLASSSTLEAVDYYNVGTFALQKNRYNEAIQILNKCVKIQKMAKAYNNLGRAYEGAGDLKSAADAYVMAADSDSNDKIFAKNAAVTLARIGDSRATQYAERSGMALDNFDMATLQNLVTAGKYRDASDLLNANESKYQDSAEFFFNKGVVLYKLGEMDGCIAAYRRSETLKDDPATIKNLSIALYMKHDYVAARESCDQYIAKVGRRPDALQNLGAVLAASGHQADAIGVWRELLAVQDIVAVRLDLADALWNSGDSQGARYHYSTVIKVDANNARALNGMGLYALSQAKTSEAEKFFRQAISSDKNFFPAYNNLAISLERLNHKDQARKVLHEVLGMKPDFEDARKNLDRMGEHH